MNEQLAHREEEEEEKEFMKLTSNFHNSHTSEHCGILSIDIFLLHHLFYVDFTSSIQDLLSIRVKMMIVMGLSRMRTSSLLSIKW